MTFESYHPGSAHNVVDCNTPVVLSSRAALSTPFRHRAVRSQSPAPTPEDEANAFDELGDGGRSAGRFCSRMVAATDGFRLSDVSSPLSCCSGNFRVRPCSNA